MPTANRLRSNVPHEDKLQHRVFKFDAWLSDTELGAILWVIEARLHRKDIADEILEQL